MKDRSNPDFNRIETILKKMDYPIVKESGYRYFSVLLPLVEMEGELHLLFERRARSLASQPNEICFPGGGIEKGETPLAAAIRETAEELFIPEDDVKILAELPLLVTPFGTILHPFLGKLPCVPETPNPDEVSELFTVPLSFFMENEPEKHHISVTTAPEKDFAFHLIENGDTYRWGKGKYSVFFYVHKKNIIWGMTAKLVHYLVSRIKEADS